MLIRNALLVIGIACGATAGAVSPANAFISLFMMADRVVKQENAKALATPGHANWCAKQKPGYRKQWNNWRLPNGRVEYCASPYFTPIWMKGRR